MKLDFNAFISSLSIVWKGFLGIFVIVAVIVLVVYLLNKAGSKKKDKNQ